MNLENLVNDFISYDVKSEPEGDGAYRPKIHSFKNFIIKNSKSVENQMEYLITLDISELDESVAYYISESKKSRNKKDWVETESTLRTYFTVIFRFLTFVNDRIAINSNLLKHIIKWDKYTKERDIKIAALCEKHHLKPLTHIKTWEEQDVDEMMLTFWKYANLAKENNEKEIYSGIFEKYIAGLVFLFIYETGIKPSELSEIKIGNIILEEKKLTKGDYEFPISNDLVKEIEFYLLNRHSYLKNEILFTNIFDNKKATDSSFYSKFLSEISKGDVLGLVKYRIKKYKEQNIPSMVIKEFTGADDALVDDVNCSTYNPDYTYINKYFEKD